MILKMGKMPKRGNKNLTVINFFTVIVFKKYNSTFSFHRSSPVEQHDDKVRL